MGQCRGGVVPPPPLGELLGVDAERGDGLGAGLDALLWPLPLRRVRRSRLPRSVGEGGVAGGRLLRRALVQQEAGRALRRPLLAQRDGVYHLDPADGDHGERRSNLELRVKREVTVQDLVRRAGLVTTAAAPLP